tara:strand:+ start:11306 stop:12130 length:825 start_codon:yes stop_codon:yes gene_type:complete
MRQMKRIILLALLLSSWSSVHASNSWDQWKDLAKLKPDAKQLQEERSKRAPEDEWNYTIQRVSKGSGKAVNVDEYAVQIDALPTGMSKNKFFWHVRQNLNDFLDQDISPFGGLSTSDKGDWDSQMNALVGTLMKFEIKLALGGVAHDTGVVVVSRSENHTWTFSPVEGSFVGSIGTHPVAGNRQFGLRTKNGKLEFFTRAFDRVFPRHVSLAEQKAFEGADKLWKSLQENLVDYINNNGGSATALTPNVPGGNNPNGKPQYKDVCKDASLGLGC